MSETKVTYLNRAQQEALAIGANVEIPICSRRFGKSFGIVSRRIKRNVQFMPGSTGAFVASSFKQARTRTLPAALSGLREAGFIEGIHYVIGKRPPEKLGFAKPIIPVQNYEDVVTFYNGTQMIIISQDVRMSSNSLTLDWIVADEAKGLDYDKLKDETFPANGGTMRYFSDCPWHHSVLFVSDMPVLKSGRWLLNYREKATPEVNDLKRNGYQPINYFNNNADEIARNVSIGTYSAAAFTDIDSVPAQQVSVRDIDDTVYGFCFNCADAFLANEYVRLALMFCVKKDLFEPPEGCSFTRSCVPVCCKAGELNYREQVSKQMPTITYDEERALEYWNAGLEVLGVKSLGISLLCEEKYSAAIRSQIQIWQQVFSVSLSVNIVTDTENNIEKLLAGGEYQFAFAPVHSSGSSAADYLAGFIPGKSTNIFGFEGEEYEKMINGALNVESRPQLPHLLFCLQFGQHDVADFYD